MLTSATTTGRPTLYWRTNKWAAYLDGDREPANPKVQALTRAVLGWMDRH